MSQNVILLSIFKNIFKNVKTIIRLLRVQKQFGGQIPFAHSGCRSIRLHSSENYLVPHYLLNLMNGLLSFYYYPFHFCCGLNVCVP